MNRPVLVGWSYGATIAVRYAARRQEQIRGLVLVDGAYPIAMFDKAGKEKVVGTGGHSGATEAEMRTVRAAAATAVASNPRVSVFATTPHKHTQILSRAPDTVVAAIEDVLRQAS